MGFNNTGMQIAQHNITAHYNHAHDAGNVCVWPSEEVLAHILLQNATRFNGRSVVELGGGMTSLAGLMLATHATCSRILLTDGNETSTENIQHCIDANSGQLQTPSTTAKCLVWGSDQDPAEQFDYVICADCLFFEDVHSLLLSTIGKLLEPNVSAS